MNFKFDLTDVQEYVPSYLEEEQQQKQEEQVPEKQEQEPEEPEQKEVPQQQDPEPQNSSQKADEPIPEKKESNANKPNSSEPTEENDEIDETEWENYNEIVDENDLEHLNIVFIGHVDAGKSTISGNILYLTDMVDQRTIEKYEKEAEENNRGSWFLAFVMDTNEEERAKGKTVECGRAHFKTEKKRYTILDAPGHKNYVPNMITGVSQADVGILVISARKGEFEAGFDRNGQTREHAIIAKTLGVKKMIVVVNKMDEQTVMWNEDRFKEIKQKLSQFLKSKGYSSKDVAWIPISGISGANLKDRVKPEECSWYKGPSLLECLDSLPAMSKNIMAPLRMPVLDKYKEMGNVVILGKVESGLITSQDTLTCTPGSTTFPISSLEDDEKEIPYARPGENIKIFVKSSQVEADHIFPGCVISHQMNLPRTTDEFVAQICILELVEHNNIFTAGYEAVIHIHTTVEEIRVVRLLEELDPKTGKRIKALPKFVKNKCIVNAHIKAKRSICMERYQDVPQLGRFTLRDEGKTIAFGKILATHAPVRRKKNKK